MSEEDWGQMLEEQEKQQQEQQLNSKVEMPMMIIHVYHHISSPPPHMLIHLCHRLYIHCTHTYPLVQLQSSLHVKDSPVPAADEPSDSEAGDDH